MKFSKARGVVGYLIPVVFQQKLDFFEPSPVGHTFAVGCSVSQVQCKPASCYRFLTLGKKSLTVFPSQDPHFTANSKDFVYLLHLPQ